MIIRQDSQMTEEDAERTAHRGPYQTRHYSQAGGLTQFGAYVMTLQPGARSANRHWHEKEDEFMYVLSGEVTVVENDGAHVLGPGDAACWPAAVANADQVVNRSAESCAFWIAGTKVTHDVVRYPDAHHP